MKKTIWLIECGTGCTCCNYENHIRGPYDSEETAQRRIDYYNSKGSKFWPLASQYARRGRYDIEKCEAEILDDDRYIVDDQVYHGSLKFINVNEDGTVLDNETEYFGGDV